MACPFERTKHGFEQQIGTNYFGHYYLVKKLLSQMKQQTFESRIVIVSSVAYAMGDVDFSDINYQKRPYKTWQAYGQSKTALILWGRELAKQLKDTKVKVYSLHPGVIYTNLQRHAGFGIEAIDKPLMGGIFSMLMFFQVFKSIPQGAATTVYACVAKDIEDKSGEYLSDCHVEKTKPMCNDMQKAEKLTKMTDELLAQVDQSGKIN